MCLVSNRHCFHEVAALRALMRAARPLRENGNEMKEKEMPLIMKHIHV